MTLVNFELYQFFSLVACKSKLLLDVVFIDAPCSFSGYECHPHYDSEESMKLSRSVLKTDVGLYRTLNVNHPKAVSRLPTVLGTYNIYIFSFVICLFRPQLMTCNF